MRHLLTRLLPLFLLTAPSILFAAPRNLKDLVGVFLDLINPALALLTGLAVLFFVWGIVQYILYAGDEKKKLSAKNTLVYGVVALFVLFSFWGIVEFIQQSIFN
ncbi:MAG: pilin [Patescibacteria group bacterium]